jgi:hypothetical protein
VYTGGEKYLDTAAPYTSATISILDVTASTTLRSNIVSMMLDFRGQCLSATCTPPSPQFVTKPTDKIIRLNI